MCCSVVGVGGLAGYVYYGNISNSYSTGNVNGNNYVGGLIGHIYSGTISNTYSTGSVTGTGNDVGGLIGMSEYGNVSNSYSTGNVNGNNYVGGLVGHIYSGTISNSFWDLYLSGQSDCTGNSGNVSGCTGEDGDGTDIAYFYGSSNAPLSSWDFTNVWLAHADTYPTFIWASSSPPSPPEPLLINFTDPTPASGTMLAGASVAVNVTVSENATCSLTMNSTVYEMSVTNASAATHANYTVTALSDGFYAYHVNCSGASGASNYTETRNVTIDTANPEIRFDAPTDNSSETLIRDNIFVKINARDINFNYSVIYLYQPNGTVSTAISASSSSWCYQESADASTACGGLDTGSYGFGGDSWVDETQLYDGDWNTSSDVGGMFGGTAYMYIDYAKPSNALPSSLWQVKIDKGLSAYESNYSIPSGCFAQDPLQFRITSFASFTGDSWVDLDCYNGTDYIPIYAHPTTVEGQEVWEEAMWWDIGSMATANFTGLADGLYYFNATAYDKAGNFNKTETRNVTIHAKAPEITLAPPTPQNSSFLNYQNAAVNATLSENASQCTLVIKNSGSVGLLTNISLWTNIRHLNITGGVFDYNASIGVNNYSSFNMLNRNPVSAGTYQTCYLRSNGSSTCYGGNNYSQSTSYTGGKAIAASSGYAHTCYLLSNGNSTCYGSNSSGSTNSYTGGNAIAVAAGLESTCYLLSSGNSTCYGLNGAGQSNPYTGGNAIAMSAGQDSTCYLLSSGNSTCFGANTFGQSNPYTGGDAIAVSAGRWYACYLLSSGNSTCYGYNGNGQATNYTGGDAIAVSSGAVHTCYLLSNGTSVCYGDNYYSQATNYTVGGAIAVSAGGFHTCYLLSNGNSVCYGDNTCGGQTPCSGQSTNYIRGDLNIPFMVESNSSSYDMFVDNADNGTTANATLPALSDGAYSFFVNCTDFAGNSNSSEMRGLTIDTQAPTITITSPGGSIDSSSFLLSFIVNDTNLDSCRYSLDNGTDVALPNCTGTTASSSYGHHCVTVYANDTAGNINSSTACFVLYSSHVSSPSTGQPPPPEQNQTLPLHLSAGVACTQDGTGDVTVAATSSSNPVSSVALAVSGIGGTFYTDSAGKSLIPGMLNGTFTVSGTKDGYDSAQTAFSVSCAPQNITAPPQPNVTANQTGGTKPQSGGGAIEQPQGNVSAQPSNVTSNATSNATVQPVQNQTPQPGQNQTPGIGGGTLGGERGNDIISQAITLLFSASKSPAAIASAAIVAAGIGWYVFRIRIKGQALD